MWRLLPLTAALPFLMASTCNGGVGDDPVTDEPDPSGSGTASAEPTSTGAEPTGDDMALTEWAGQYTWTQTAEGDPGSPQTVTYDLTLDGQDGATSLTGEFAVTGFQVAETYEVSADPKPDEAGTVNVSVHEGPEGAAYGPGTVLFSLSGDPLDPTTTLVELQPLVADTAATGSYFQRVDAGGGEDSAVDHLAGTEGVTVGDSLVVQRYGDEGPEGAVAPETGPAGTAASGCVVDDDTTLPDGIWAGNLVAIDETSTTFDLACYYTVESAQAADPDSQGFEDFRIVDEDDDVRTNDLDTAALTVHLQTAPPVRIVTEETETVSYDLSALDQLQAYLDIEGPTFGFLLVENGRVVEFYSPPLASA